MANLFENNERKPEEQMGSTDVVNISHNGVRIGSAVRTSFGDLVELVLNDEGIKLFQSRIAFQID